MSDKPKRKRFSPDSAKDYIRERVSITPSSCWEWLGPTMSKGYAMLGFTTSTGKYRYRRAHRASYEAFRGPIADGLFVCHSCDNRKCVNPDHLWLGTHQDNMNDMKAKGRQSKNGGDLIASARLKREDIPNIKALYDKGLLCREIAAMYGVCYHTILDVVRGRSWKKVSGIKEHRRYPIKPSKEDQARANALFQLCKTKFTSGNEVSIDRITIKREEWDTALRQAGKGEGA